MPDAAATLRAALPRAGQQAFTRCALPWALAARRTTVTPTRLESLTRWPGRCPNPHSRWPAPMNGSRSSSCPHSGRARLAVRPGARMGDRRQLPHCRFSTSTSTSTKHHSRHSCPSRRSAAMLGRPSSLDEVRRHHDVPLARRAAAPRTATRTPPAWLSSSTSMSTRGSQNRKKRTRPRVADIIRPRLRM